MGAIQTGCAPLAASMLRKEFKLKNEKQIQRDAVCRRQKCEGEEKKEEKCLITSVSTVEGSISNYLKNSNWRAAQSKTIRKQHRFQGQERDELLQPQVPIKLLFWEA